MWKENLEETKKRYTDWWNHKGTVVNMWEHFQEGVKPHADVPMPKAPKDLNQKWFDPKWRANYLDWYVAHSSMKGDMLPVANTQLGPGSLAAILGGVFEGGEDTIWIHPNPNYTDEITFDPNCPNYLLHKDLLKACKKKAKGNYYVGMPDLMEGLDVLAAMKGTDKVLLDTVMQPEVLEKQMQQINDIYFKVFDELYDIIREGDEMAFCYFSSWAPGKMTKLQSDISTMISVDDYLRFVQPFIREQCQRIPYTLYHLDGVGALHHLPALLDIKELNAIQWTPGVGEPQGGSDKWYDLYRKILDAGKSIMACWVTLDELPKLLDNIGTDGVHLEMDFHNEQEVEQAVDIVEKYRSMPHMAPRSNSAANAPQDEADRRVSEIIDTVEARFKATAAADGGNRGGQLARLMQQRIMVIDGAMGTMIQQEGLTEEQFRAQRMARHTCNLKGCNDLLSLTQPDVIFNIHRQYLEAGADIITTNTFNAQQISMADYLLQPLCREMNLEAARLARRAADEYSAFTPGKPRFVMGSMGPTGKTCSLVGDTQQPGWNTFNPQVLTQAYLEQATALIEGGVDGFIIETIFDTLNASCAISAARQAMRQAGRQMPIMLSFAVATSDGHNMLGQDIVEYVNSIDLTGIISIGINCTRHIAASAPLLQRLGQETRLMVSFYPNAGMPNQEGHYDLKPEVMQREMWYVAERHLVNVMGGCCGTTPAHIRALTAIVEPIANLPLTPHRPGQPMAPAMPAAGHSHHAHAAEEPCDCCKTSIPPATSDSPAPTSDSTPAAPVAQGGASGAPASHAGASPSAPAADGVFEAILAGKAPAAAEATRQAIAAGLQPQDIINGQMIRAMSEVGQRFQDGKAFVPQLLMAGRAMKAALELLKPLMAGDAQTSIGKVVIGTVKGDLHDIGKNLVASMLEGCGFEVVNIGIDVDCQKFIEAVKENNADILCMSALLTTTMTYMKDVIQAMEEAGIRDKVRIMVGGAPVTQGFANEIGADGYSDNANSAVALAKELMKK